SVKPVFPLGAQNHRLSLSVNNRARRLCFLRLPFILNAPPEWPMSSADAPPNAESFLEHFLRHNPFTENRVNSPSEADADVGAVHQQAFQDLTERAYESLIRRHGLGAVVWGEAGIGKSHLLARLGRWAGPQWRSAFVYVHNLQAAPERIPRTLLGMTVGALTQGSRAAYGRSHLSAMGFASLRQAVNGRHGEVSGPDMDRAYQRLIDAWLIHSSPGDAAFARLVHEVLYYFTRSVNAQVHRQGEGRLARLAVRWLSGQALPREDAEQIRVPVHPDGMAYLADNQEVKQVFVALSRLARGPGAPFILALDQVDNLETDQASALTRFLEALLDSCPNLLVVTAGIQATLLAWKQKGVIQESAWDRVAQFKLP